MKNQPMYLAVLAIVSVAGALALSTSGFASGGTTGQPQTTTPAPPLVHSSSKRVIAPGARKMSVDLVKQIQQQQQAALAACTKDYCSAIGDTIDKIQASYDDIDDKSEIMRGICESLLSDFRSHGCAGSHSCHMK